MGTQWFWKGFWMVVNGKRRIGSNNAEDTVSTRRVGTSLWKNDYYKELKLQIKGSSGWLQ